MDSPTYHYKISPMDLDDADMYQFDPLAMVQYETYACSNDYYPLPSIQVCSTPSTEFYVEAPIPRMPIPRQGMFVHEPQLPSPVTSGYPSPCSVTVSSQHSRQDELTPPHTPTDEPEETVEVAVSTAFHPGSHSEPSDLILCTTDSVLFYVNSQTVQNSSSDAFSGLLHAPITSLGLYQKFINVPDTAEVLNVILHCLYGTSYAQNAPSFDTLETAFDRMPFYSITPSKHIVPGTPSYAFMLTQTALNPMRVYALAAHHNLEELAAVASSHLLAVPLSSIQDDMAEKMGAVYLNRLVHLMLPRVDRLKDILLTPPSPHPATNICSFEDQKGVTTAWALVAAYLAWDARPDLSTYSIRAAFNPLLGDLTCEHCKEGMKDRIKNVVVEWAKVKRTI